MAIRGNRRGLEFYYKILEIKLSKVTQNNNTIVYCTYEAGLFANKTLADESDDNMLTRTGLLTFEKDPGNNYEQQCYSHLTTHLGPDFIEDIIEGGNGLKIKP